MPVSATRPYRTARKCWVWEKATKSTAAAHETRRDLDLHEAGGEAGPHIARQEGTDAHREEVGADDGGELRDRIAEQVGGGGGRDQLIDEPRGGYHDDGDVDRPRHGSA